MRTAATARILGSGLVPASSISARTCGLTPESWSKLEGRYQKAVPTTSTAEIAAEMKNPRLIADIAVLSLARGATRKMPTMAVSTPIMGTRSGNTSPSVPKATRPRISEATSTTA
ncbi:hypothetical protein SUDANB114_02141 [Nocardiopsis dassonvillei]